MEYYIYLYLDPRKPGKYQYNGIDMCFLYEPIYVGKGKGDRIKNHLSNEMQSTRRIKSNTLKYETFKKIMDGGNLPIPIKIYENMAEKDSFNTEKILISSIGKKIDRKGPLTNMSDGGKGGDNFSPLPKKRKKEILKKISKSLQGKNGPPLA